jgi:invasion protein IalB
MSATFRILLSGICVAVATVGYAQVPPPQPQRTSASYGDWSVRCELQAGTPPQKSCDVALTLVGQGQAASPVAQVLITRPNKKEPMRLVMQVQPNVSVAPGVKLVYDDKQPALALPFSRCFPNACFASGPLTDDAAKKLRARTEPGRVEFKDGNQHDVAVPVSFNGFTTAFDAWQKE